MKKIMLLVSFSILALTACSKPNTDTQKINQAPEQTATQVSENTTIHSQITPTGDQAEHSLDWAGEYKGVCPCADCEGIETELELKTDKTYELTEEYLGKGTGNEFKVKGTFSFDANHPSMISLDKAGENRKFFIGENFAEARDRDTGEASNSKLNYKLQKQMQ